jgi:O-antigen/teichoic acid export membrane protein
LSRLQYEPERYREYYLRCVSLLAFVSMPLVVFMFVCSDQLIGLVLGAQWLGASEIFKILAIAALFQPVSSTSGMVLISTGRSRRYLILGTVNAVLVSISFVLGLPWGGKGVATAYAIVSYLILFPNLFYAYKGTSISIKDFILSVYRPLVASLVMGFGCFLLLRLIGDINVLAELILAFTTCAGMYLLTFSALSGGIFDLREYFSYGRLIFERK